MDTGQNLVTRAKFAAMASVNQSSITKVCKTVIYEAVEGKFIDANHPVAQKYLQGKSRAQAVPVLEGVDPLYEEILDHCRSTKRWSQRGITEEFHIPRPRINNLLAQFKLGGVYKTYQTEEATSTAPKIIPRSNRGQSVTQAKKKAVGGVTISEDQIPERFADFADKSLKDLCYLFGTDVAFMDWLKGAERVEAIDTKRIKNAKDRGELVSRVLVKTGVVDPIDTAMTLLLTDAAEAISIRAVAMHQSGSSSIDIRKAVAKRISSFIKPMKEKIARALREI